MGPGFLSQGKRRADRTRAVHKAEEVSRLFSDYATKRNEARKGRPMAHTQKKRNRKTERERKRESESFISFFESDVPYVF